VDADADPQTLSVALYDHLTINPYFWADIATEAVALAFAGLLHGRGEFAKSMLFAVNLGRDSDTNAAIAGCIAGAMSGIASFPKEWVDGLVPVAGDCIRTMAGIHPLDVADQLITLLEESHA
ncbi:MAG: ADP-ribosylglycohydrolase family protein, partial [Microbacterium sp.]